jgi:hypothetical protein
MREMTTQTMVDALRSMAALNDAGDETMIKDNANYPVTIWGEIDDIQCHGDIYAQFDLAVSDDRITLIRADGMLSSEPIYRRV